MLEGLPRLRLRYEFLIVLCVRASSWKDAMLSRFMTDDRRAAEGRARAEEVLRSLAEAGLTLKVKRHLARDGAKLLMVYVTASAARLERQAQRLRVERWLADEGVGDMSRYAGESDPLQQRSSRQPNVKVVRVGGLHYFAPVDGGKGAAAAEAGSGDAGGAGAGADTAEGGSVVDACGDGGGGSSGDLAGNGDAGGGGEGSQDAAALTSSVPGAN